jgi:hypothetical protein
VSSIFWGKKGREMFWHDEALFFGFGRPWFVIVLRGFFGERLLMGRWPTLTA